MIQERRRAAALRKELTAVIRKEEKFRAAAEKKLPPAWKVTLEQKVPPKVYAGLEAAFQKGFSLVFQQGSGLIEKTLPRQELENGFKLRAYAFELSGKRKDLKQMRKSAGKNTAKNMAVTTAEGLGLGALGIGMPDIVLFLGTLLRGIRELSLSYGYRYDDPWERLLMLKLLAASLSTGADFTRRNGEIDAWIQRGPHEAPQEALEQQMQETASVFAADLLVLKFIQGLPLVGILGGAANPVYYRKVLKYAELKYRRRFLLDQMNQAKE